jgi:hypothetical protein
VGQLLALLALVQALAPLLLGLSLHSPRKQRKQSVKSDQECSSNREISQPMCVRLWFVLLSFVLLAGGEKPTGFGAFAAAGGAGGGFGGFAKAAAVGADATKSETEASEKLGGEEGTGTTEENNATKAGAVETQTKEMPKMVSSLTQSQIRRTKPQQ